MAKFIRFGEGVVGAELQPGDDIDKVIDSLHDENTQFEEDDSYIKAAQSTHEEIKLDPESSEEVDKLLNMLLTQIRQRVNDESDDPREAVDHGLVEYQNLCMENVQTHKDQKEELMHWALGLCEEAGEVASYFKHRYYSGDVKLDDLVEELGDVLWHIAAICTAMDIALVDVAEYNIAKLRHRYPGDDFDLSRSKQRRELKKEFRCSDSARHIMRRIMAMKVARKHDRMKAMLEDKKE